MLSRLFGNRKSRSAPIDYDAAKELARHQDPEVRRTLAQREDTKPEILYYLAEDPAPAVRREIAANKSTPGQANLLLANDVDPEVRCDLARKIGRLLPNLSAIEASRVQEMAFEVMELMARDQLPRVRAILAEELKHSDRVPHDIVRRLAFDVELIVSAPILEYSPLLSDEDLLEIIASGTASEALAAIARRKDVSAPVSDAVVATLDVPAVAALLANTSAQIREDTLDAIIDHAAGAETWHGPLVMRNELSVRAIRRISQFVASSLVNILADRHQLPRDFAEDLQKAVRQRIDVTPTQSDAWTAVERVEELFAAGKLDDNCIAEAIERGERDFVQAALAARAKLPPAVVAKIMEAKSPKGVTALAWKAALPMRLAMRLQLRIAGVPPKSVMNARHGVDYPLSDKDLQWQIDYFVA